MIYLFSRPPLVENRYFDLHMNWPQLPAGLEHVPRYSTLMNFCEPRSSLKDGGVVSKLPLLARWNRPISLEVSLKSGEFPDMYYFATELFVSYKVMKILQKIDQASIQFSPVEISVSEPSALNLNYFSVHVRNHVQLPAGNADVGMLSSWLGSSDSKKSVAYLQNTASVYNELARLPWWRLNNSFREIFLSKNTLESLKSENVSGVTEYVSGDLQGEETISHVSLLK